MWVWVGGGRHHPSCSPLCVQSVRAAAARGLEHVAHRTKHRVRPTTPVEIRVHFFLLKSEVERNQKKENTLVWGVCVCVFRVCVCVFLLCLVMALKSQRGDI